MWKMLCIKHDFGGYWCLKQILKCNFVGCTLIKIQLHTPKLTFVESMHEAAIPNSISVGSVLGLKSTELCLLYLFIIL